MSLTRKDIIFGVATILATVLGGLVAGYLVLVVYGLSFIYDKLCDIEIELEMTNDILVAVVEGEELPCDGDCEQCICDKDGDS